VLCAVNGFATSRSECFWAPQEDISREHGSFTEGFGRALPFQEEPFLEQGDGETWFPHPSPGGRVWEGFSLPKTTRFSPSWYAAQPHGRLT